MKEYKTSILIGIIYIAALVTFPLIRSISLITLIFFALQFLFHGAFVLVGDRADGLHRRFTETHLATVTALGLYGVSAVVFFISVNPLIKLI